ncbi:MAG TPA: glycosyltransferase family 9 protein [Candidatus Acidoferrales bacterium]|nr:glycosyltransferase family 9 protein [Candidatus Acidoferrales bacterium]
MTRSHISDSPRRLLILRLGSLGDIIHALPVAATLRAAFPSAYIAWLVDKRWRPLLEQVEGLDAVLSAPSQSWIGLWQGIVQVRRERFDCVVDVQGLYKSALPAWLSGAPRRVGFNWAAAREGGASMFYNLRVSPKFGHRIEKNLALAAALGARAGSGDSPGRAMFPLRVPPAAEASVREMLRARGVGEYFMVSPGGGWLSKCWPAERYGELHRRLAARLGYSGLVSYGPGERSLAEAVRAAAGSPEPLLLELDLPQLMAALRGARFFVGADTGPLHLSVALGTPVVGLYGPTDPLQTGPYSRQDVVIRNALPHETTYRRGSSYSRSMLSISVEQVEEGVTRRLAAASIRAEAARS